MLISIPRKTGGLTKPPLGTQLNRSHPLSQGLLCGYLFNEGGGLIAYDVNGKLNATQNAGTSATQAPGIFGNCISFPGTTSGGFKTANATDSGSVTASVWVNYSNRAQSGMFIEKSPVNSTWEFFMQSSTIYVRGASITSVTATAPSANTWNHLLMTIAGTTATIYINGVVAASGAVTAIGTTTSVINLGCYDDTAYFYTGLMDLPFVWNRVLSSAEIQLLYTSPFCMMQSVEKYSVDVPSSGGTGLIYQAMIG